MTAIRGAAAAVTGAASGIGRALALELAARGCDLALADRDEAGLQALAAEIAKAATTGRSSARSRCTASMSASPTQIADFAQAAISAHPGLNIVVNNAGVALLGQFAEIDQAQIDWLMNINFWGVVHSTRAFLPHLSRQREAHIVNLSSIFGIVAPPGQTAYAAAKFAVRGFSESLRHELQMAGSPVQTLGGASRRRRHQHRAQFAHRHRHDRQRPPRGVDRAVRRGGEDDAAGRRAPHHRRHREEQAAHPDRQRRAHDRHPATPAAGDLLESAGEEDRAGGEQGELSSR